MRHLVTRLVTVLTGLTLSACSGLTEMQDSLNKFGTGATSASTTEMTFLNNVQSLDCTVQFYSNTALWVTGAAGNYDLTGQCNPGILTNAQLTIRQNMLDAITVYAGKIQALASTSGDQTLDADGQKLATNLNALAGQAKGITKADASIAADVEAALIQLATIALDKTRYDDAKKAASEMQPQLETVVKELQAENTNYAAAIQSERITLESGLRAVVNTVPPADKERRFMAVIKAREIIRTANPFGQEALAPSGSAQVPTPDASKLNAALDAVVAANKAIATSSTGGISAAVTLLVSRAQAAQADATAIQK